MQVFLLLLNQSLHTFLEAMMKLFGFFGLNVLLLVTQSYTSKAKSVPVGLPSCCTCCEGKQTVCPSIQNLLKKYFHLYCRLQKISCGRIFNPDAWSIGYDWSKFVCKLCDWSTIVHQHFKKQFIEELWRVFAINASTVSFQSSHV